MAVPVYSFPPVRFVRTSWTEDAPVNLSRSMITGRAYISSALRKRKMARLVVPARAGSHYNAGAGYMEILKRLLSGGENLVRLSSPPINWHLDATRMQGTRNADPVNWTDGGDPVNWTDGGDPVTWYEGTVVDGVSTTDGGWPAVEATGLPPNLLVARPAEFVTVFSGPADLVGETVQVASEAWTDASGVASIRLMSALPFDGRIDIGTRESAVFRPDAMPTPVQPLRQNWFYDWSFTEVFEDEVDGGFANGVAPWT
ncbi:MAG: hypothetical protein ACWA5A_09255 [Marinibacterium sp.]